VAGTEAALTNELKKANQEGIPKKLQYLETNFYNSCLSYAKDIWIHTGEWICCQISGTDKPEYTIHRGSKM